MNDELIGFLIPFVISGLALLILSLFFNMLLDKYEFHNRSDGGVIKFDGFAAAKIHRIKRWFTNFIKGVGVLILLFSFLMMLFFGF